MNDFKLEIFLSGKAQYLRVRQPNTASSAAAVLAVAITQLP